MATYRGAGTPGEGEAMPTEQDLQDAVTAAELAETNAAASEAAASTSEANAATSETNSAASAAASASSATDAETAQTAAELAETNAETAETNAETAETNAETAETGALAAQTAAEAALDEFTDLYLGSKASDPTLDNDGDALQTGAIYWNSTSSEMRVYNGAAWEDFNQDSYTKAETYSQTEIDAQFAPIERPQPNALINGDMNVWQRGTYWTGITSYYYFADRWIVNPGVGTWTISRVVDAPTIAQAGRKINYCLDAEVTTAGTPTGTNQTSFQYRMEGYDYNEFRDQTYTISWWFKASTTGTYNFSLRSKGLDRSYVSEFTVDAADTWEQKSITVSDVPSSGGTWNGLNDVAVYMDITMAGGTTYDTATLDEWQTGNYSMTTGLVNLAGTIGNYARVTGIKMEHGSVVTPTVRTTYDSELDRCHRYYHYIAPNASASVNPSFVAAQGNLATGYVSFPAVMRDVPTITIYDKSGTAGACDNVSTGATVAATVATYAYVHALVRLYKAGAFTGGEVYACGYEADAEI